MIFIHWKGDNMNLGNVPRVLAVILLLLVAYALFGCGPDMKGIVTALAQSDRSWCAYWAGTPAFSGPFRISGSGVDGGSATCTAETFNVQQGQLQPQFGGTQAPAVVTPGGDVILRAQPRIWLEGPPQYEQVDPQTLRRR